MRTTKFIGALFAFILICCCSKQEKNQFPRNHVLQLNFQDAFGTEILKDIPNVRLIGHLVVEDKDGWCGEVKSDVYKLDVVLPKLCFELQEPLSERNEFPLFVNKIANRYYLHIEVGSSSLCPPPNVITYKLICPHIFGDDDEHIITSYWRPRENSHSSWILEDGTSALNYCYRITLDGKEVSVTQELFVSNHSEESKEIFRQITGEEQISKTLSVAWIILDN